MTDYSQILDESAGAMLKTLYETEPRRNVEEAWVSTQVSAGDRVAEELFDDDRRSSATRKFSMLDGEEASGGLVD